MTSLKVLFSIIAVSIVSVSLSQNPKADSLDEFLMDPLLDDSLRVIMLHEKCRFLITNDPEKALSLIEEADSLSNVIGFKTGKAVNRMLLGGYYSGVGRYQKALHHFKASLDLFASLGDSVGTAASYLNIGTIYASLGSYSKAIEVLLKSLEISERNGDFHKASSALMNIGNIYYHQKNYGKALMYKSKALEMANNLDNKSMILLLLNNIGLVLIDMGKNQKALESFNKGLALSEDLGNRKLEATILSNIGGIKVQLEQYSEATNVLKKSLVIAEKYNFQPLIAHNKMVFCQLFYQKREYDRAVKSGEEGLLIAQSTNDKEIIKEVSYYLSESYAALKNYKKALLHLKECKAQADSLLNKDNIAKITLLEETYKNEKQKSEIEFEQSKKDALNRAESKQQRVLLYLFMAGFVLMMTLVIVMVKMYFQKKKKNQLLWSQKSKIEELNVDLQKSIDSLKSTQSMLVQSEKMASLGILTSGVAHEINNPLNYIMGGYVGLKKHLPERGLNPEDGELIVFFDLIKNGLNSATNIVKSLGQIGGGSRRLNERCDLHEIIDNCLTISKSKRADVTKIKKHYNSRLAVVAGNIGNLHQVILNLLTNAYQALEAGGNITINTIDISSDKLSIEIIDDGLGIAQENLQKVTDPFFTTREPGEGKGLGLSITYSLIKEHGGELIIESELKKGTRVQVILPKKITE